MAECSPWWSDLVFLNLFIVVPFCLFSLFLYFSILKTKFCLSLPSNMLFLFLSTMLLQVNNDIQNVEIVFIWKTQYYALLLMILCVIK